MSMDVIEFGEGLLKTGDLDPVYIMLSEAGLHDDQLHRWLLAYWCFYHCGLASYASEREGADYWGVMERAAQNITESPVGGRWPRASERRHFRGDKCIQAVSWMRDNFLTPSLLIHSIYHTEDRANFRLSLGTVQERVKRIPQFGPWIGFKVADMIERVLGLPVEFPADLCLMYDSPRKALDRLAELRAGGAMPTATEPARIYHELLAHFAQRTAPPLHDRACGPQEVETILCKWGSSCTGHYHVGRDLVEIRHGMAGWGEAASGLLRHLPTMPS